MTFQQVHKLNNRTSNQDGVTLLLAILVLSAITAIVFSIAAIAVNEIKTSSDLTRTEPVLTAAEAVAEDSLFKLVRGLGTVSGCASPSSTIIAGVTVTTCASYYLSNPYTFSLPADGERDFYLYNPTDQTQPPGYTQVSVQITSGSTGTIYFCTSNVANCISTPDATQTISTAGPTTWTSSPLTATQQYQLMVVNGLGGTSSYSVTSVPNGLPAGTTTIQDSGNKQGVTRKLEITVPQ
ncbi:MAG: hypothetical protein AAB351_03395 [Patescibacteria group bacterium]